MSSLIDHPGVGGNANVYPRDAIPARAWHDLGWVRYALGTADELFHSIDEIACGAIFIECSGSMSALDRHDLEARPAIGDRCRRCQAIRAWRRLVEMGLVELVDNTGGM